MSELAHDELANHIIEKYRALIKVRYDYEPMKQKLDLPDELTKEVVDSVRTYFLNSIYPPIETRRKIEAAFATLGSYMTHPGKIWRLLGNMTLAAFKFGKQFPAALKAGYISLQSYLDAKKYEKTLLEAAIEKGFSFPISDEQFEECMAKIPREDVEDFLNIVKALFRSLTNEELLERTIMIMHTVISKMQKFPHLYSETEIEGIYLGIDIIENGYKLFSSFDERTSSLVIDCILQNEHQFFDEVYSSQA